MRTKCLRLFSGRISMYDIIKKKVKSLIPEKFLFKNELFFRYFHGVFLLGNIHQCNICSKKLRSFILLKNKDLKCPFCGSLSRNRRLWSLLEENNNLKENILHFSPSRSIYRMIKKNNLVNYFSTDFEDEFLADYRFDITRIEQENNKFDTVICYHILEHIKNDRQAMAELYRVLKPSGILYIQTPFKDGDIFEDDAIVSPEDRIKYFGQDDHVRIYSVSGLRKRLEEIGFSVLVKSFKVSEKDFYLGFRSPETVLVLTK